ncbi:MAG: hypothetical protein RBR97_19135 [Bacteroidales bacterium]|nr:hypothetical protein [Bacteroidales bacterium]
MAVKTANIQIRTTEEIKEALTQKAKDLGFTNLTEYMLFVAQNAEIKVVAKDKKA